MKAKTQNLFKVLLILFILFVCGSVFFSIFMPLVAFAQVTEVEKSVASNDFEVSAWIPYWRMERGVESILPHLELFTEVNPFVYTVKENGSVHEATPIRSAEWQTLKREAIEHGIDFIPTVMWASSDLIHDTLSDQERRQEHIRSIVGAVYQHGFDGIDIDYEAKYAKTREHFSQFLKELEIAMGYDKKIMCTMEQRTPLEARFSSPEDVPSDIEFANDFTEINKYCDRVRIMAYDQGRYDLRLNETNEHPYAPVADTRWVTKVMQLISEEVDKDKLMIGVPTYGYEYDMFEAMDGSGRIEYSRLWSFNPGYIDEVLDVVDVTPVRHASGEMVLTYPAKDSPDPAIPLPEATRVMFWSDAESVREKIALAKEQGLRGISIFKIDGGQDKNLWDVLKND